MDRRALLKSTASLLGGMASASLSRALSAGASIHPINSSDVFTPEQQRTVSLLAEMIIPTTDTPGAIEAGVPDFIATIVAEWYNSAERTVFFEGLKALDQFCIDAENKAFHLCSNATRHDALRDQETITLDHQSKHAAKGGHPMTRHSDDNLPFFGKLKELVVVGYYTSEVGAKQELSYLPMPGYYDGEFDFNKVGRPWIS